VARIEGRGEGSVQRRDGRFVEWLGRAESGADALGGKAASLDRLGRLGFRIPSGFCLTTSAFRAQVASLPAAQRTLGRLLETGDVALGDELADIVASAPLAPSVQSDLDGALADLRAAASERSSGAPRLAVRSSAIGEDGTEASYAGLHETELDRSIEEAPEAIRRCWASLWSRPALAYRVRRNLPLDGAAMAVVVQELVPADAAAVAFTRHPVTGRDDQLVITAIRGLGEAMVSGTITPDTFLIDRASRQLVELTPGDDFERPLDAASLRELVDLVLEVEARFGAAVDVEAAMRAGTWFLLQARPITTGSPAASLAARSDGPSTVQVSA
jgi:rifampicin phosphotransferase